MRTKLTILAGILGFCASLQAGTSYSTFTLDFNTVSNSPGLQYDGSYAISPYSGTVNGASVTLYCDDFNDTINFGQQNITVYSTALGGNLTPTTRYGADNPSSNNAYPSGTTLYEEMAWLATQMQNTSGSYAANNDKALQEAIWQLTDAPGGNAAPNSSSGYNGTASSGDSGTAQSAAQWIADAQAYITGFNGTTSTWSNTSHYTNLVVGNWYIITAESSAGCTTGSSGTTGCTPGTAGTGSVTQEFLAYKTGGLVTTTTNTSSTPEPATFALIGSGLLAGAFVKRRRKA